MEQSNYNLVAARTCGITSAFKRDEQSQFRSDKMSCSNRFVLKPLRKLDPVREQKSAIPVVATVESSSVLKMQNFRLRWALKRMLRKLHGISIPQKDSSGVVTEEWTHIDSGEVEKVKESKMLLRHSDLTNQVLQPMLALSYLLLCWYVSLNMVFILDGHPPVIKGFWLVVLLVDVALNLNTVKMKEGQSIRTHLKLFKDYLGKELWFDLLAVAYIIVEDFQTNNEISLTCHAVILIVSIAKFRWKDKLLSDYTSLQKYLRIIESILLLLVASHLNALLLFWSSKFAPERCWLQHVGIQNSSWGIKYIYSLYWAVTTIVTVGYGDITPQNEYEVAVTIVIELTGSALFGYLINVIGATMSELKKKKQNLRQELNIADRLVKCLSVKDELAYQLKSFLKDNQKGNEYFSIKEEKRIWEKLKPDLKQRILQQTNVRVIKECLFFLTHFSKDLQDVIALKLVKKVFQPNQRLDMDGIHNFYIIEQGKADLQSIRMHYQKPIIKTLRSIDRETKKDKRSISSNLFGFTAALLNRRVNLTALSKQFIVTYELLQKDFEELVCQFPRDFEAVCQLRDNILNSDILQSCEAPELVDPRMHYTPIKYMIVRKNDQCHPQRRRKTCRLPNRSSLDRFSAFGYNLHDSCSEGYGQKHLTLKMISSKSLHTRGSEGSKDIKILTLDSDLKDALLPDAVFESFEQAKSYNKYFINSNIEKVLKRYNPADKKMAKKERISRTRTSSIFLKGEFL